MPQIQYKSCYNSISINDIDNDFNEIIKSDKYSYLTYEGTQQFGRSLYIYL